jgi:hypothetical protein
LRGDALRHLALEHQHQGVVPRRPRLGGEPADKQRSGDVVGQVGHHARAAAGEMTGYIECQRIAFDDLKPARIARGNFLKRGDRALVAFDGDHFSRAFGEQRPRQAAGAGPDFEHGGAVERPAGTRNACGQIEIEQEILAKRFLRRQFMPPDHITQRRQVVDLGH